MASANQLLICEYGGDPRSGKGTIVERIASTYPGVAKDEAGTDYRVLTIDLMQKNKIEPGESEAKVKAVVEKIDFDTLAEIVANGREVIDDGGRDELYHPDVNSLVHLVAPNPLVRKAVKAGFRQRVEAVRDGGDYKYLLIDGRNLADVVRGMEGVRLLMRTFVACRPYEAAYRQCAQEGKDLDSADGFKILEAIQSRIKMDGERLIDPSKVDRDAVDYWPRELYMRPNAQFVLGAHSVKSYLDSLKKLEAANNPAPANDAINEGTASYAIQSGRQLLFDTSLCRLFEDPPAAMLRAAEQMFEEAMEASK